MSLSSLAHHESLGCVVANITWSMCSRSSESYGIRRKFLENNNGMHCEKPKGLDECYISISVKAPGHGPVSEFYIVRSLDRIRLPFSPSGDYSKNFKHCRHECAAHCAVCESYTHIHNTRTYVLLPCIATLLCQWCQSSDVPSTACKLLTASISGHVRCETITKGAGYWPVWDIPPLQSRYIY